MLQSQLLNISKAYLLTLRTQKNVPIKLGHFAGFNPYIKEKSCPADLESTYYA